MVKGVQFKKGAMVLMSADAIHHDPNVWTNPDVFNCVLCSRGCSLTNSVDKREFPLRFIFAQAERSSCAN